MGMNLSSSGGMKPEINVTPMIDVLLVLIIIFILIQPHEKGLPSEVPQPSPPAEKQPQPENMVVLEITSASDGKPIVRINTNEVSREKLEATLRDIFSSRTEKVMFVKGDAQLDFLTVADVIDITRSADPQIRVGLMTRDLQSAD
jgi:biopolymer transport protein TolR